MNQASRNHNFNYSNGLLQTHAYNAGYYNDSLAPEGNERFWYFATMLFR